MKNPFPVACFFALAAIALFSGCKERTFNSKGNSVEFNKDLPKEEQKDVNVRAKECDRECPKDYYCTVTRWEFRNPDYFPRADEVPGERIGEVIAGTSICTTGNKTTVMWGLVPYEMLRVKIPTPTQNSKGEYFTEDVYMNCKYMSYNTQDYRGCFEGIKRRKEAEGKR
jgi:hypothetical protein